LVTAIWEAQTLRATFFPTEAISVSGDWWVDFTGAQPDSESKLSKDAIVVVSGAFSGKLLLISSGVGRVDVVYQPLVPTTVTSSSVALITAGPAEPLLDELCARIGPICDRLQSVHRLALGGVFLKPVGSREEAYEELKNMLKSVAIDPQRMRDFLYRVNWPVKDALDRPINRIGVWSSILAKVAGLTAGVTAPTTLSEDNYVKFEFDINTAPEVGVQFVSEAIKSELSFLRRLLEENLEIGEVLAP
jgi:hypothetical protein